MPRDDQSLQLNYGTKDKDPGTRIRMEAAPAADTFEAVYDRSLNPDYRYILSRVQSVPEAEDLASQTFLTAFETFPRFREQGRTAAWLFTIARNKIVDSSRRRTAEPLPDDGQSPLFADEPGGGWDPEFLLSVRMRISALPEEEQELIRLRYVADLSFAGIAAGAVLCWGTQTGAEDPAAREISIAPVPVSGLAGGVIDITAGDMHVCVLAAGGMVKCWGMNALGQLGDGTENKSDLPVDVLGLV